MRAALSDELQAVARRAVAFAMTLPHRDVQALVAMGRARATSTPMTFDDNLPACPTRSA